MRTDFAFGKTGLSVDLPEGPQYRVLETRWAEASTDEASMLADALDHPIGCPPLVELAAGRHSAAISVCDITRPAPNRRTLPPLLARLEQAGIPKIRTTILIATGLHRQATESEIVEILGAEIAANYPIVNHNARELADHRELGVTKSGTPVFVDRRFVDAELRITLGFIEQHLMAGFSGGRKLIAPGLAYQETIKNLHSPRFMRDARAVEGSVEQNPLHQELLEIAQMAGHDFVFDVVLSEGRKIAAAFAGEPRQAHAEGIAFVRASTTQWIPGRVDAAITSAAGYPLDLTFYQGVKGVTAASHIVKPGGIILLMAACDEGAGAPEFSRLMKEFPDPQAFLETISNTPVTIDQWQLEKLAMVVASHRVWWYTPGLPPEYHANIWGKLFPSAASAFQALRSEVGSGAEVAVLPEGPYVLARPQSTLPEPALV
ncbi:nickel-dependent lactate racemase family protein [Paludibaculum fermentans]|uniref:Nickel-dependent lactate racemase n=1 Tax=Paludibaculum fermentans TaxID=1473598 RepID=A0A7S7SMS4_PALFE|nr:nickel-dependent lactate racemase [Paludibaculum fermentans]QOY91612.1 nickel-dependent lactate racemase [Paludibaculum fermentans]